MKVLLVTPSYYPIIGGSEALTKVLLIKLNEMGIHADIMTFNMNKKWNTSWKEELVKHAAISIFREPALNPFPNLSNPLFNLFRMNVIPKPSFAKRFKEYDVIHFIGEADLSFPIFSYFIKKPKVLQCVGIFRNGGIYKYYASERVLIGKIFKKVFSSLADRFVISSNEELELLLNMGIPKNKIAILPMGVDTKLFRFAPTKTNGNIVLFVGRIDRIKGLHLILKALPFLKIPVQLIVIGPPLDTEYVTEIERMAYAINKTGFHNVALLGGINQNDLVSWYQKAAVLVCPYIYETCSNVVRESLACGTPVISTGSHLIEDCPDGILLTRRDPKAIANAISKLLRKPDLRERLGQEGRGVIEQHFSLESTVKDLVRLYDDMVNLHLHY